MKDIRFRTVTGMILSVTAFVSLIGAVFVILWWLLFTQRFADVPKRAFIAGSLSLIAVIAVALEILQGTGISYGARMTAVMLVAVWLWSEYRPGELLNLAVWALGNRYGFDLGLVAELSLQAFSLLLADLGRMRVAWAIKGVGLKPARLPAAGFFLTRSALVRAQDTGELLAVRGYRRGGTLCPHFLPSQSDVISCGAAVAVCIFSLTRW